MSNKNPSSESVECQDNCNDDDERNAVEAGMVRGFFRSFARFPAIGRLPAAKAVPKVPQAITKTMPKHLPTMMPKRIHFPKKITTALKARAPASGHVRVGRGIMRRRVPVKDVARISDRVSQGLDVYDIATKHDSQGKLSRLASFVTSE